MTIKLFLNKTTLNKDITIIYNDASKFINQARVY